MIADIIVAQQVTINKNGDRIVVNPNNLFKVPAFPTAYSFSVSLVMSNLKPGDLDQISLKLEKNGKIVRNLLQAGIPEDAKKHINVALNINVQNIEILASGKSSLVLLSNDEELVRKDIFFEKADLDN